MLLSKRIIKGDIKNIIRQFSISIPLIIFVFLSAAVASSEKSIGGISSIWVSLGAMLVFCICINAYAKSKHEQEIRLAEAIYAWMDIETLNVIKDEKNLFNEVQAREVINNMMEDSKQRRKLVEYVLKAHNNVIEEIQDKFKGYIK